MDRGEWREELVFILAGGATIVLIVFFVFFSTTGT